MILVDTSVWIEFFRSTTTKHARLLAEMIEAEEDLCLTEIILAEILQGIRSDKVFDKVKKLMSGFPIFSLKGTDSYVAAANIFRICRKKGHSIRKTIDCLIAQTAIENNLMLFHKDKDFEQIAKVMKLLKILNV